MDSRGDNMGVGCAGQAPHNPGQPAQAPARLRTGCRPPPEFGGSNLGDDDIPF